MPEHKQPPNAGNTPAEKPQLCFNWEDWLTYVEEYDYTEAQKRELIEIYWKIMLVFIDLSWEVEVGLGAKVDNSKQDINLSAALKAAVVQSENHQQKEEV